MAEAVVATAQDKMEALRPFIDVVNQFLEAKKIHNTFTEKILDEKDSRTAHGYNMGADEWFKNKENLDAIKSYTTALCYAEDKSGAMASAYAGRASVLLKLEYYKECVEDLDRALECTCSDILLKIVKKRRSKAEKKIPEQDPSYQEIIPEIPRSDRNKKLRGASKAVEVVTSGNSKGKVVAARDIPMGEVFAVLKPYTVILKRDDEWPYYCEECLLPCLWLIPCPNCTQIMFCSNTCRQLADKKYHKYECSILKTLQSTLTENSRMALRLILKHKNILEDINAYSAGSSNQDLNNFYQFLHLHNIDPALDTPVTRFCANQAAISFYLFDKYTDLFKGLPAESKDIFKGLAMKLEMFTRCYFHNLAGVVSADPNVDPVFAIGVYPLLNQLRHSCATNIMRNNVGKTMVVRAAIDIKKGSEILDAFGTYYVRDQKEDRDKILQDFNINCTCEACEGDWPTFYNVETCIDEKMHNELHMLDQKISADKDESYLQNIAEQILKFPREKWPRPSCEAVRLEYVFRRAIQCITYKKIIVSNHG